MHHFLDEEELTDIPLESTALYLFLKKNIEYILPLSMMPWADAPQR